MALIVGENVEKVMTRGLVRGRLRGAEDSYSLKNERQGRNFSLEDNSKVLHFALITLHSAFLLLAISNEPSIIGLTFPSM
jgi:hypothetical protein